MPGRPINLPPLAALTLLTLALPTWAADPIDVTKAGVIADGTTLNTTALQKAIDDCAAAGGGTLRFPAGRYVTGTLQLKSNITLHLDDGATLLGSSNAADYRNLDPFIDGAGSTLGHALIVALDVDHAAIEGPGTIDGQGPALRAAQPRFTVRPFLIRFVRCSNITVKDAHLTNPGAWTLNFYQTKTATVDNLTIRTRSQGLANNDGIDVDSSENFRITNCDLNTGDDALVIKATGAGHPCQDIVATNCTLSSRANAIKLGTESIGGFADVTVSHCQVLNTQLAGIALNEVDGADLHNVTISDISMDGVHAAIALRLGARLKAFRQGDQPFKTPGTLRDITIRNVTAKNVSAIGILINGVPGHPVENVTLDHIDLAVAGGGTEAAAKVQLPEREAAYPEYNMFGNTFPAYGLYARHIKGLTLKDVQITPAKPDARPPSVFLDAQNITPPPPAASNP